MLYYPPRKENGQITVPGGLFIATDLSPFMPSIDRRKLKMKPYVVEDGRVREFKKSDMTVAKHYIEMLQEAQKRMGSFKLSAPSRGE